jgi:predicted Rossmann-fold nucleotide-binding protein
MKFSFNKRKNNLDDISKHIHQYKILLIGGMYDDDSVVEKGYELGKIIAKRGHPLITGACWGTPEGAVRGAFQVGGTKIIGYSPFFSLEEHMDGGDPAERFTSMKFLSKEKFGDYDFETRLKMREVLMINDADGMIMVGGITGAFNEFASAYRSNIPTVLWKGTGKYVDSLYKIRKSFTKDVYFSKDPLDLVLKLEEYISSNKR